MKKHLNIILPLVLILLILVSICWYFLEYDTDLTRDIWLRQAQRAADRGNYSRSIRLYDRAYRHSSQDPDVAIELARQYSLANNYTKAESVLRDAITAEPCTALYIALCRTYAAQDKLRDAVQLLDGIQDADILQQIGQLRPAAPAASFPSGIYREHIRLSFRSDGSTIYAASSDYPSIQKDEFTGEIRLTEGNSTFYVVAVNESGLVSPLSVFSYTVTGVVTEVFFIDDALERDIRHHLGLSDSGTLTSDMLWNITSLRVPETSLTCADLIHLPRLKELTITGTPLCSADVLQRLTMLETLHISDNVLSRRQLEAIAALPMLENLTLRSCQLADVSFLEKAVGLKLLDLSDNQIISVTPLQNLNLLTDLCLAHNPALSDLIPLLSCKSLKTVMAAGTAVIAIDSRFPQQGISVSLE